MRFPALPSSVLGNPDRLQLFRLGSSKRVNMDRLAVSLAASHRLPASSTTHTHTLVNNPTNALHNNIAGYQPHNLWLGLSGFPHSDPTFAETMFHHHRPTTYTSTHRMHSPGVYTPTVFFCASLSIFHSLTSSFRFLLSLLLFRSGLSNLDRHSLSS